jgi:hypothetical protein
MDPAGDPCLAQGPLDRVDVAVEARVARVATREPVELFVRSLLDELDAAANQEEAVGVVRVDDEQARARVALVNVCSEPTGFVAVAGVIVRIASTRRNDSQGPSEPRYVPSPSNAARKE